MAMWICVISIVLMSAPVAPGPRYSSRIVDTQAGPVRGVIQSSNSRHVEPVEIFYGIPYAAPPVGARRFTPAQEPLVWTGTRLADTLPPVCPQQLPETANVSAIPHTRLQQIRHLLPLLHRQSEDCLHLNIYVPGSGSRGMYAPYAVIVYVHGESFEWNTGNAYDGRILTGYGHVIFVTINYRLGILGFLKTQEEFSDNQHCCFAISDIEASLRWINSNIAAFGGDPSRVTLVGHDTGAALVNTLMLHSSARGLFHRVTLLSGSLLSPWAVVRSPHSAHLQVIEKVGCTTSNSATGHTLGCLQALPLNRLMEVKLQGHWFLPQFGPWFSLSPSVAIERAGDTFVDRQMLLGLTSIESFHDLSARHIEAGLDLEEKDHILRMFVNNMYSHHLKEIFSAVRNEYTVWNKTVDSPLVVRDSVLFALSDGLTAAPLVKLAYLHSRRGAITYLFHLTHQTDRELRSLGLDSVRGDILSYILGYPLSMSQREEVQDQSVSATVAHTVLRFFTNFAKTGDPNSPGAEPDYENDKGGSNIWDMYEPVKQLYLSIGEVTKVQSHYRGHKMALWLNLIQQLLISGDNLVKYREFKEDEDNLYAGVVRPKIFSHPPTSTPIVTTPQDQNCVWNNSTVDRPLHPPLQDVFRLTGPWGITFAIGCLLLLCNLMLFASVYRRHFQYRSTAARELTYREERLVAKSQSAPELTSASFLSERISPTVLKRSQNKSLV